MAQPCRGLRRSPARRPSPAIPWRHGGHRRHLQTQGTPQPFLIKIVPVLAAQGLVTTHRGARGGVSLARPPEAINLWQVVSAIDGPFVSNACTAEPSSCPQAAGCASRAMWRRVELGVRDVLEGTTVLDLAPAGAGSRTEGVGCHGPVPRRTARRGSRSVRGFAGSPELSLRCLRWAACPGTQWWRGDTTGEE